MIKRSLSILFFLIVSLSTFAQIDFEKVIPPEGTRPLTFEDYLVQLAWQNNPIGKIGQHQVALSQLEVKKEKKAWMEQVAGNVGFNSIKDTVTFLNTRYLAPGYNYGISFSIGAFFTNKNKVDIAKEKVKMEEFRNQQTMLEFRNEVLNRHQKYLQAIEILKVRKQAENDAQSNLTLISELFETNKTSFEDFNEASISYHNAQEKRIAAETEVELARLALEEIIGEKWEIVERAKARFSKRGN